MEEEVKKTIALPTAPCKPCGVAPGTLTGEPLLTGRGFSKEGAYQDGSGASDGNRTRVTCLEGRCSTIELHRRITGPGGPGCENNLSVSLRTAGLYSVERASDLHGIPPSRTGERRPDRIKLQDQRNELLHGDSTPFWNTGGYSHSTIWPSFRVYQVSALMVSPSTTNTFHSLMS